MLSHILQHLEKQDLSWLLPHPPDQPPLPPLLALTDFFFWSTSGLLWTVAYYLFVRVSLRQRTYGMPLLALVINVSWEIVIGFIFPAGPIERGVFCLWGVCDLAMIWATLSYGPERWRRAEKRGKKKKKKKGGSGSSGRIWVAENWGKIYFFCQAMALAGMYTAAITLFQISDNDRVMATFVLGYFAQFVLGWGLAIDLVVEGTSEGQSWGIWFCRTFGSIGALGVALTRMYAAPDRHGYIRLPVCIWTVTCTLFVDCVVWPVAMVMVVRKERAAMKVKVKAQ